MKFGRLFSSLAMLVVLGGLVWWSKKHPTDDAKSKTPPTIKLISMDAKQIETLRIAKSGADPIELANLAGTWTIAKPKPLPADQDAVGMLTGSLASVNADRLIDEHPANLNDFGLTTPSMEIDLTVKGGKTTRLLLGSDTPAGTGLYAKLDSDPKVYTLPTFTKSSFYKSVNDLRDKRLLSFNQDKLTSVKLGTTEFGKNDKGEWQITKPKPMRSDTFIVDDLIGKLKDAKMDLSVDPKTAAPGEKLGTASTTDNTGTQTLDVYVDKDKTYYARSSVVPGGFYKLTGDINNSIGKSVDDFRSRKLFDFGFTDPTKLEINGTAYQKSADKWTVGGVQFEAGTIQSVIDKLRDLTAAKFIDKMAGTTVLTVAVTSGDKNRYEKVVINKDGDTYDAQRDGDPSIYSITALSIDELQKAISLIKHAQPAPAKKK